MRQDAWSEEEDERLAEIVLDYISKGKTQLSAFQEVERQLSRTSAACGFRWNAYIRKSYEDTIEQAKKTRKLQGNKEKKPMGNESIVIEQMIALLQAMKERNMNFYQLGQELQDLQREKEKLDEQLERLKRKYSTFLHLIVEKSV